LNGVKKWMFVMVTGCVLFEVRTEILNGGASASKGSQINDVGTQDGVN
jgi:hypothetical protein